MHIPKSMYNFALKPQSKVEEVMNLPLHNRRISIAFKVQAKEHIKKQNSGSIPANSHSHIDDGSFDDCQTPNKSFSIVSNKKRDDKERYDILDKIILH